MRLRILIALLAMVSTASAQFVPSQSRIVELSKAPRRQGITIHERSSFDLIYQFQQNGTNVDLSLANQIHLTYTPHGITGVTQTVTGLLVNPSQGVIKIPFKPFNTATNGTFDWVISVASNGVDILKHPFGELTLIKRQGTGPTNSLLTVEDLSGIIFINFPWATPGDDVNFINISGGLLTLIGGTESGSNVIGLASNAILDVVTNTESIYLLTDGTRAMTGNLDLGGNSITNIGTNSIFFNDGTRWSMVDGRFQINTTNVLFAPDTNNLNQLVVDLFTSNNAQQVEISGLFTSNASVVVDVSSLFTSNLAQQTSIDNLGVSNLAQQVEINNLSTSNLAQQLEINANTTDIAGNLSSNLSQQTTIDNLSTSNLSQQVEIDANTVGIAANLISNLAQQVSINSLFTSNTAQDASIAALSVSNLSQQTEINANTAGVAANLTSNLTQQGSIDSLFTSNTTQEALISALSVSNLAQQTEIDANTTGVADNLTSNLAQQLSIDALSVSNLAQQTEINANTVGVAANLTSNLSQQAEINANTAGVAGNLTSNLAQQTSINDLFTSNTAQEASIADNLTSNLAQQTSIDNLFTSNLAQQVEINDLSTSNLSQQTDINALNTATNTHEADINSLNTGMNALQALKVDTNHTGSVMIIGNFTVSNGVTTIHGVMTNKGDVSHFPGVILRGGDVGANAPADWITMKDTNSSIRFGTTFADGFTLSSFFLARGKGVPTDSEADATQIRSGGRDLIFITGPGAGSPRMRFKANGEVSISNAPFVVYGAQTNTQPITGVDALLTNQLSTLQQLIVATNALPVRTAIRVNSSNDLPAEAGGVHTLLANTTYLIDGTVVLTAPAVFSNGTMLVGQNVSVDIWAYQGTETALIASNNNAVMRNFTLSAASGRGLVCASTDMSHQVEMREMILSVVNVAQVGPVDLFSMSRCQWSAVTGTGVVFVGISSNQFIAIVDNDITTVGDAMGAFDFNSAEVHDVTFSRNIFRHTNSSFSISGALASSNIVNAGSAKVNGNVFHSGALENITKKDKSWIFLQNLNVTDSTVGGQMYMTNAGLTIVVVADVPTNVLTDAYFGIGEERIIIGTNGVITIDTLLTEELTVNVTVEMSPTTGNDKILRAHLKINDVIQPLNNGKVTVSAGDPAQVNIVARVTLAPGDTLRVAVENTSDSVNIVVDKITVTVSQ